MLPYRKGEKIMRKVRKRIKYDEWSTGKVNYNTMHDKSLYEVEYPDGTMEKLEDNIIAKNMMSQVDYEGNHYQVLTEVTDHKKDDSNIVKMDGFIKSSSGKLHRKSKTYGWKLLVEWKDGSVDWVLKELKHYNPVELSEYATKNKISDEPAFNCWVKYTM